MTDTTGKIDSLFRLRETDKLEATQAAKILDMRVNNIESLLTKVLPSIDDSLKTIVRLETLHHETREKIGETNIAVANNSNRITVIEKELPTLIMVRNWAILAVTGSIGTMGAAIFEMLKNH